MSRERLDELQRKIQAAKDEVNSVCKKVLDEELVELFNKYPKLEKFNWQQYTPYFNDGDPCEFSVYADEPGINSINGYDFPYEKEIGQKVENEDGEELKVESWMFKARNDIKKLICSLDDDFLELAFGDHVEVTIYRDGKVKKDEYSHD